MNVTILNPLSVTQASVDAYVQHIAERTTQQLHDAYQLIWLLQPKLGYADLKPLIDLLRAAIIHQIRNRPGIPLRPRLVDRIHTVVQ
jgi:hypothetical protein